MLSAALNEEASSPEKTRSGAARRRADNDDFNESSRTFRSHRSSKFGESINPYEIEFTSTEGLAVFDTFESMPCISEDLLKGICAYGLEKPSAIQSKSIVPINEGKDVIVQAQSGAGKTICFCLGILSQIELDLNKTQALILSPSRELAQQTRNVAAALGDYMNVTCHYSTGKSNYAEDIQKCQAGYQIISGSPGRLLDMISKGYIDVNNIKSFVLDEADLLLDAGMREEIYETYRRLPPNTQTVCVSATFPHDVLEMTTKFMDNPIKVLKMRDEISVNSISNYFITMTCEADKFDTLCDLFDTIEGVAQSIVYVNTKEKAEWLKRKMYGQNFNVAMTHGELEQKEREELLKDFRTCRYRVLITTDLMSRGIDVQNVSLVINYDIPAQRETYLHRIGRSGRFGKRGIAINLATPADNLRLMAIGQFYNIMIDELSANIQDLAG